ncbi:MAG: ribonuclease E/G [Myxococcota bacterium]
MQNEIVINAEVGETRVALVEGGSFAELHIERKRDKSVVGNVVKGKVSRVLPGMQAAFVDIGLEKAAFLYVGDYFESKLETGETAGEPGSRGRGRGRGPRSAPPRIDTVLHEGKEIIVQIAKEPIGTKGARITSSLSIPGRHLVLTPWSRRVGVSRRIGSDKERRRLREIVERVRPPNLGFIIRTAGDGVREADLEADIRYLATVWAAIQHRHAETSAPAMLYSEHDLPLRIVRDLAGHDTKRIVTDNKDLHTSIQSFVDRFVAEPKPNVEHYEDNLPVFERFGLESQIHENLERKVWLKSGGSLVIDKSEALTAIDVNTGRFVGKRDLEETVLKTNLEAVQEVVHQLRFRNLGGLIIIDLIDMESAGNRDKVYRALQEALRYDKARTNILKISELGLVEMTRKRTRENLVQTLCEPCSHCEGRSYVLSRESVAFRVMRQIRKRLPKFKGRSVAVSVNPHVAEELLVRCKEQLKGLGEEIGRDIEVRAKPGMHQEQFELTVLEPGPPVDLEISWLKDKHPDAEGEKSSKDAKRGGRKRGRSGKSESDDESNANPEADAETDKPQKANKADTSETDASAPAAKRSRRKKPSARSSEEATDEAADETAAETKTKTTGKDAKKKSEDGDAPKSEAGDKTEAKADAKAEPKPARKRTRPDPGNYEVLSLSMLDDEDEDVAPAAKSGAKSGAKSASKSSPKPAAKKAAPAKSRAKADADAKSESQESDVKADAAKDTKAKPAATKTSPAGTSEPDETADADKEASKSSS